jgi:2-polyprenyl-3-methyl-5-hydroxy-6-metoxy-1,4-benzoquinol methylase
MQLDWLQIWRELVIDTAHTPDGELIKRYKKHAVQKTERPDSHLEFILNILDPACTVLDIGAGSGRWTVPLAGKSCSVTAVEPSEEMAAMLRQNLQAAGLANVPIVRSTWEEAEVDVHDVSVCAHAMYSSPDLAAFVRKMEKYTRRACYLAMRMPPADGIMGELSYTIYGRQHDSANAIIAYNALYSLGIYCNVLVENEIYRWTDSSLEEAFLRAKRRLNLESNNNFDGLIRDTLARRLQFAGNRYVWPDGMRSLLLWWKVGRSGL